MPAYTAQQLADLRAAMATGALRVQTASMETIFRSLAEMQRMEQVMAASVESVERTRVGYASFSKD